MFQTNRANLWLHFVPVRRAGGFSEGQEAGFGSFGGPSVSATGSLLTHADGAADVPGASDGSGPASIPSDGEPALPGIPGPQPGGPRAVWALALPWCFARLSADPCRSPCSLHASVDGPEITRSADAFPGPGRLGRVSVRGQAGAPAGARTQRSAEQHVGLAPDAMEVQAAPRDAHGCPDGRDQGR